MSRGDTKDALSVLPVPRSPPGGHRLSIRLLWGPPLVSPPAALSPNQAARGGHGQRHGDHDDAHLAGPRAAGTTSTPPPYITAR